ncbi:MAG: hypothetical protein AAF993_02895 [Pseudomonadota bacterium]
MPKLLTAFAALILCTVTYADEIAYREDGSRVLLRADGTWSALPASEVSGASDEALKTSNKPVPTAELVPPPTSSTPNSITTTAASTQLVITKVDIVSRKTKRAKYTNTQTRMWFHVQVTNSGPDSIELSKDRQNLASNIITRNSRGTVYQVITVDGCPSQIAPAQTCEIIVVAEDSPRWFGVNALDLQILPDTLGNPDTERLSFPFNQVGRRQVNEFVY